MTIRCLAVDDEPIALEKLENYISKIPYLELTGACESAYDAMKILAETKVDAIFIDINMPDMNGMEFISSLPERPMVVFITAYSEYAVESYKVMAVDYILKPFGFNDFQRAASKLLNVASLSAKASAAENKDSLYLKADYKYTRVSIPDIRYIEGMNEYIKIHLASERQPLLVHMSLRQIKENLPSNFLQVHRSFIVSMNHVSEVERGRVLLGKDEGVPIGDNYKDALYEYLLAHSPVKNTKK